jgi:hypothetical protein
VTECHAPPIFSRRIPPKPFNVVDCPCERSQRPSIHTFLRLAIDLRFKMPTWLHLHLR